MADRTVAAKLLVKPDSALWLSDTSQAGLIGELPPGASLAADLASAATAILFAQDAASLRKALSEHERSLGEPATFWVAYPKANRTDINRDTIWPIVAEFGMRPIGQVAIDDTWSALRFRKLKTGEAPFTGGVAR